MPEAHLPVARFIYYLTIMQRSLSAQLTEQVGAQVLVKGWLHNFRALGKISFLILRDRDGLVQVVVEDKEQISQLKSCQVGSIIEVAGIVAKSNAANGVEITKPVITIKKQVTEPTPVEINKVEVSADLETMLDYRAITLRTQRSQAIFRIQATIVAAYREYLSSQGFTEFFGPNVIGASSEGGTELFKVEYFDRSAMLSQSAQLYKQMMVGVYERVFALMKCFRAEKSATRRHLTEATQFEFEMGFIEDFGEIMDMLEATLKHILSRVVEKNSADVKLLGSELPALPANVHIPRVKFRDALEIYFQRTGIDERHEIDLSPGAERELCKYAKEQFGTDFIFVTNFLRVKTAFYAKPNEVDPTVTNYFDLLCREIEIVSGGQRIHDHDELVESLKLKGLNPENFTDYLSIFKFGMPAHGGFGMGMERLTMMMLGLENIREATLFPSDIKRVAGVKLAPKVYLGGEAIRDEITRRFSDKQIQFQHLVHVETPTSEDSARERGTQMHEGVKSIIVRGIKSGKNYQVNIPSDKKVDMGTVSQHVGEKVEMESPDVIATKFGLKIGGVPPFGNLLGISNLFTSSIKANTKWAFNCGLRTESIVLTNAAWLELTEAEWGEFAK